MTTEARLGSTATPTRRQRRLFILTISGFILYPILMVVLIIITVIWAVNDLSYGQQHSQAGNGTVTAIRPTESRANYEFCYLDFSFTTDAGEFTGSTEGYNGIYCAYQAGDAIKVTYDPAEPELSNNFNPTFLANHGGPFLITMAVVTHLVLAGAIWTLVLSIRSGHPKFKVKARSPREVTK